MKTTKAPWVIRGQDIIGNEPNGYICTWSGRSANARLIAAAPELLEVCKRFSGFACNHLKNSTDNYKSSLIKQLEDAIAKATE